LNSIEFTERLENGRLAYFNKVWILSFLCPFVFLIFILTYEDGSFLRKDIGKYFYLEPNRLNSLIDYDDLIYSIEYVKEDPVFEEWANSDEKGFYFVSDSLGRMLGFSKFKNQNGISVYVDPLAFLKKIEIKKEECKYWI